MIIKNKKCVIIHPPRCGGTTIEMAIYGDDYFNIEPNKKHLSVNETLLELKKVYKSDVKEYKFYGLIRHPYFRLKSMHNSKYWSNNRIKMLNNSFIYFITNLKPAIHEGKNLKLVDYYDNQDIFIELYDIKQHQRLVNKLQLDTSNIMEKKKYKNRKYNALHEAMVYFLFIKDYKKFSYKVNNTVVFFLIPICMILYPLNKVLGVSYDKVKDIYRKNRNYKIVT